jgi:5-methylcytosine-specific restriction endonuclease McrA
MQAKLFVDQTTLGPHGSSGQPKHAVEECREPIRSADVWRLLRAQSFLCAMTGRPLTPETASIDHRIPLARGGRHAASNLQIVHKDVNTAKNTMTHEEFLDMCREVVRFYDGDASG